MTNFYKRIFLPLLLILLLAPFLVKGANMTYTSSRVTQNTDKVITGAVNQQVIGIQIVTSGSTIPLSVTSFSLSTSGTTSLADITNARLYYTGTSATFNSTNQFGSVVVAPNGTFVLNGTQTLAGGTNYFWLTYDIPANATIGNLVDATCSSLTVGGLARIPSTPAPAGAAQIDAPLSGTYTINQTGSGLRNYTTFNAAIAALNAYGVGEGGIIFSVASGQTFNEAPLTITATGTSTSPITFTKSGSNANPIIQGTNGTGSGDKILTINAGDYIVFDGIDFKNNPASNNASLKMEYGIYFNNTATNGSMYNSIRNSTITLDKGNTNLTYGIYSNNTSATSAAGANSYNSFYNNTIQNAAFGIYLNGHSTYYDAGNAIGSEGLSNTITNITNVAIRMGQQTNGKVGYNYISDGVGINIKGIHVTGVNSSLDIYKNKLSALITESNSGIVTGIHVETASSTNINSNSISNFKSTANANSSATVQAIEVDGGISNIYNNIIFNIDNASSGNGTGVINGILIKGGSTISIYNNMVSDLRANTSKADLAVRAISLEGGTTINLFFNSLYLSGVAANSFHTSATLYITATPGSVDMRNNILYNDYNIAAGARAVALYKSTTSLVNIASTSNNNVVWAGIPSTKNLLFYNGTNADQTLAAYKTRLGPTRETATISVDPHFVSATDLHLSSCFSPNKGQAIAGITQDIDGDTRAANPVIGADEMEIGTNIVRWLGTVSTDWNDPANWSCSQVPVSSSEVVISATATNQPVIPSGTAVAKTITIEHGASLTINGGSFTVSESFNLNGTLTNNLEGTLNIAGALTLKTENSNVAAIINNLGTIQVSSSAIVNEGGITNNGTFLAGADLTVLKGSGNNFISNSGALKIARHFSSEADVNIQNTGDLIVEGDLTTSATFLNNGLEGGGTLVVKGNFTNNVNGYFTNSFGVATFNNFYNNALIDGELGNFAIAGISENAAGAVIKGSVDICDSSLESGKKFVDNNNGIIEWGAFDTDPSDAVTQCGKDNAFNLLPVTLISWKASVLNNQVVLNWQTATEHNSAFFIVERSIDGLNFEKIGQVQAAGNSNQVKSYSYTDKNILSGTVYYRLKQVDLDAKYTYFSIISISHRAVPGFSLIVFPNPLSNPEELHLWLTGNAKQQYLIEAMDIQGRLIYQQQVELKSNILELFIPDQFTAKLKGLCVIRCTDLKNNQSQTTKLIVR